MVRGDSNLEILREEIDQIDDALHDLLMRRVEIVDQLRLAKGGSGSAFRPGREAQVLRRLLGRHQGAFPKPAIVRIWREIMAVLAALQGPFAVAVHQPETGPDLRGRARDHYGSLTGCLTFESTMGVLRAVSSGRTTLGVLPLPASDDETPWWPRLANEGEATPRVVARIPFLSAGGSQNDAVGGLAVALSEADPSGHDRSLLVIETGEDLSRPALVRWLAAVDLEVRDIQHWQESPGQALHLVEVEGYLLPDDPRLAELGHGGDWGFKLWIIGSYAVPFDEAERLAARERSHV